MGEIGAKRQQKLLSNNISSTDVDDWLKRWRKVTIFEMQKANDGVLFLMQKEREKGNDSREREINFHF